MLRQTIDCKADTTRKMKERRTVVTRVLGSKWVQSKEKIFHKLGFRVSSGFPQLEKTDESTRLKAEYFYCFGCLETLMKHEARVYEMASQKGLI